MNVSDDNLPALANREGKQVSEQLLDLFPRPPFDVDFDQTRSSQLAFFQSTAFLRPTHPREPATSRSSDVSQRWQDWDVPYLSVRSAIPPPSRPLLDWTGQHPSFPFRLLPPSSFRPYSPHCIQPSLDRYSTSNQPVPSPHAPAQLLPFILLLQ
jgi:hypothetical protein